MKRDWSTPRIRGTEGDEGAVNYAQALAAIADEEFIESIVHLKAAIDRFGGSATISAYRKKLDADGKEVGRDEVGTHETLGYLFQYEHFNKTPGAPQEPNADFSNPPELQDVEPEDVSSEEPVAEVDGD